MNHPTRIFWLVPLYLLLVACAPIVRSEQPARSDYGALGQLQSVGQSFFSRYAGLTAIEVFLDPGNQGRGDLFFHLKQEPKSERDIRTVDERQVNVSQPGFQRFDFPPLPDSNLKSLYFYLHTNIDGGYRVASGSGDSYLNGAQYLNDLAIDAQTTFRLVYDPLVLLVGLAIEGLKWLWYIVVALLLFILPGWALLSWCQKDWDLNSWPVKFTWSIGLSLAVYPLFFLWTDTAGIHLGPAYAWLPPISAILALLIKNRYRLRKHWLAIRSGQIEFRSSFFRQSLQPSNFVFLLLTGLIILVRFWPIRTLPAPMWGDSYQHTMISQLLVDNNGLFTSWKPYADLITFTYHFGFHSLVAVFYWMTGLSLAQATLWMGQILNVLAVLALYPLAVRMGRSPWVGVFAVLLAGLLSPMPMFYTNWGRYTQLAGQAILPAAVLIAWEIYERVPTRWSRYLPAWVVFSGLALTHYRILIFAVLFLIAYIFLYIRRSRLSGFAISTVLMAAGAFILFLPWLVRAFAGKIPQIFQAQITTPASQVSAFTEQYNSIGNLFTYLPTFLWLLLPIALAWGFWRKERDFALVSLWWFLIFLAANPQWFNLPGSGVISNFAVFIAFYIPVSLLLSSAGYWAIESIKSGQNGWSWSYSLNPSLNDRINHWLPVFVALLILFTGLWGARQRLRDIQPAEFSLVTWPDMRAAAWIQENTPPEARFLVNSFFAYGGDVIVGSDAGWWLPLLSGRATTLPPVNYGSEIGIRPDYRKWINQLTTEINEKGIAHPDVLQLLKERGITHIYIGQQQGQVNNTGSVLQPKELLKDPNFHPIYHQDRTWIFEINNP